jgi:putative PIN family toxin of toxin-antitoxin system
MRVVLDANVLISGEIASLGPSAKILDAWREEIIELVTCAAILDEVEEKLSLPRIRIKYSVPQEELALFLAGLVRGGLMVPGITVVDPVPPDVEDVMLFAAAIESQADYIVTGDKALLCFAWPGPGKVISPREFCDTVLPDLERKPEGTS